MVATAIPNLDADSLQRKVLAVVSQLLDELESAAGKEALRRKGADAHLEKDLGLGSLERVELLVRLDAAFQIELADRVLADADTIRTLVNAVAAATTNGDAISTQELPEQKSEQQPAPPTSHSATATHAPSAPRNITSAQTLSEILIQRGREEPSTPHITLYIDDHTTRTITFGELLSRAERVATELTRRGLHAGDTVAVMLPTGAEFFFCFAGIWLAGGIPVPMYPPFRADRIEEYALRQAAILRNAEAKFLITFRQVSSLAKILHTRVPSLHAVLDATSLSESSASSSPPDTELRPTAHHFHPARSSDIAFLQYTSGSTGDPKGVVLTHANLLANIRAIGNAVDLRADDVVVSWLPLYHDMGLIGAWFVPLCFGVPLVSLSPLAFLTRPIRWLRAISTHRGTLSPAPNFAYELCTRKIDERDLNGTNGERIDLSSWRAALNGAEPVRAETLQRFADRFAEYSFRDSAILPVYGLAEASLCVSAPRVGSGCKVAHIERHAFETQGRAIPVNDSAPSLDFVSAGMPIANVEVKIVDSDGRELPEHTQGRLWFRGASATQGYYRNPQATEALRVNDDWLDSGDLAYLAAGELYITGRAKDMIIKAGRNLYPHEMEEIAGRSPGVRTGCVVAFGAPDPKNGTERFVVAAEVRNSTNGQAHNSEESARITADIRRVITEAAGIPPDHIVLLGPNSIPKTSSGKLRRAETRRLFLTGELGRKTAPWIQIARLAILGFPARVARGLRHAAASSFHFLYGAYTLAVAAILILLCWLALLFTRNPLTASRLERATARAILACAFIRVTLSGDPSLLCPSPAARIFAANHSSYADVLLLTAVLPAGTRFVAKGETLHMPIIRTLITRAAHFAFDRRDPQARIRQADSVRDVLLRHHSVAIFPEGTFTALPGIRPFQLGTFKSAAETRTPICPVSIHGARFLLRDRTWLPRHAPISITVGPLVTPLAPPSSPSSASDTSWQEIVRLRDTTREAIAANSGEPAL
jgi:1-acyl-sn-glycerol-3-phosphate acyltransferase